MITSIGRGHWPVIRPWSTRPIAYRKMPGSDLSSIFSSQRGSFDRIGLRNIQRYALLIRPFSHSSIAFQSFARPSRESRLF